MDILRKVLSIMPYFIFSYMFSQIKVTGEVTDDNKISLGVVTIVNMSTNEKVTTNSSGQFSIEASFNDELRFVKAGYERVSRRVPGNGLNSMLFITLVKIPEDIEEVKLHQKLSGDLSKDSKLVAKVNKGEIIQQAVGLPQPVGKMREKPAEVKQVLLPILVGHLDVQGAYDLISGKARRQKRKYKYDDLQSDIMWIKSRVEEFYFTENGIPKERISEFLEFSFTTKPHVRTYVKAKNLSGVLLSLEDTIPPYVERLKSKGGHSSE